TVEAPVGDGQDTQLREGDRAALVPVAADELRSQGWRQRLNRRVERQRGEGKCEHTQHERPPWILRLGRERDLPPLQRGAGVAPPDVAVPTLPVQDRLLRGRRARDRRTGRAERVRRLWSLAPVPAPAVLA